MKAYVYFISDGKYIKIGKANNVECRVKELQCGNPNKLKVVSRITCASSQDAFTVEKFFHKELADHNVRGEWFDVNTTSLLNYNTWLPLPYASIHSTVDTDNPAVISKLTPEALRVYLQLSLLGVAEASSPITLAVTTGLHPSLIEYYIEELLHKGLVVFSWPNMYIGEGAVSAIPQ